MLIKDLKSKEARRILGLSESKETQVEAEDRLRMKTMIALTKLQRAKEQVEADEKEKKKQKEDKLREKLKDLWQGEN